MKHTVMGVFANLKLSAIFGFILPILCTKR